MSRRPSILAGFLAFALLLALTGCGGSGGDRVERFAEVVPGDGANISVPGYEALSLKAGSRTQAVRLGNPPENACTFAMSLALEDGEVLWEGEALSPGEALARIELNRALDAGNYPATLHYDCYSLDDDAPLNGAEVKLELEVK